MRKGKPKPETVETDSSALVRVIPRAEIIPVSKPPAKRGRHYSENKRHREAFEYYLALGNDRTLAKVAEHFNVSESQAMQWSWVFRWTKRIRDLENRDISQVIEDTGLKIILMRIQAMFVPDPLDPQKIILDPKTPIGAIKDLKDLIAAFVALEKNARERKEEEGRGEGGTGKVKKQFIVNVIISK